MEEETYTINYEDTTTITDDTSGENTIIQGRVPAYVDGLRCNLIIIFDNEHPSGYIAGARYDYTDDINGFGTEAIEDESGPKFTANALAIAAFIL